LEEPPPYAIFILATTEKHKIIPTILSRCQIFDFRRIQIPDIVAHLQKICLTEGVTAEPDALHIIAQKADGALRDALSIFDRIVSASDGKAIRYADVIENLNVLDYDYYFKITDAFLAEDMPAVLNIFNDVMRKGFEADIFINGLAEHLRNILVCKDVQTLQLLEVGDNLKHRYQQQAALSDTTFILTALNLCNDCDVNYKMARNKSLHVEMALIKMTYITRAVDLKSVEKKTNVVKKAAPERKQEATNDSSDNTEAIGETAPKTHSPVSYNPSSDTNPPQLDRVAEPETPFVTDDEPPVTAPEPTPGPAISTIKSVPAGFVSMPKLGSIDSIAQMIEEEEAILKQAVSKLSYENLVESWKKYAETHESPSTKTALSSAHLDLVDTKVIARVGTELAMGFIQQELRLPDFLRFDLSEPQLTLEVRYDTSLTPEEVKSAPPKKFLTPRDKLKLMMEVNPLVKDLAFKLNLKPDE
jgi:DNA polymerase-3 subunit gamma/tau